MLNEPTVPCKVEVARRRLPVSAKLHYNGGHFPLQRQFFSHSAVFVSENELTATKIGAILPLLQYGHLGFPSSAATVMLEPHCSYTKTRHEMLQVQETPATAIEMASHCIRKAPDCNTITCQAKNLSCSTPTPPAIECACFPKSTADAGEFACASPLARPRECMPPGREAHVCRLERLPSP